MSVVRLLSVANYKKEIINVNYYSINSSRKNGSILLGPV